MERFKQKIETFLPWCFLCVVVIAFVIILILQLFARALPPPAIDYVIERKCTCICPHNLNATVKYNATVFQAAVDDPSDCNCLTVVPEATSADSLLCLQCTCRYEYRNVALIAFIVYSMVAVTISLIPVVMVKTLRPLCYRQERQRHLSSGDNEEVPEQYSRRLEEHHIRWRQEVAKQRQQQQVEGSHVHETVS